MKLTEAEKLAGRLEDVFTTTEWSDGGAAGALSGVSGTIPGALWFIGNQLQELARAMNRIADRMEAPNQPQGP